MTSFVLAQYYYFLSEDEEPIHTTWNHLVKSCNAKRSVSRESLAAPALLEVKTPSMLNYCFSNHIHLYLFTFENYGIIEMLFSSRYAEITKDWEENKKFIKEKSEEISGYLDSALGRTLLLIGLGKKDWFLSQAHNVFPSAKIEQTGLTAGTLYRFEEKEWSHFYALQLRDEQIEAIEAGPAADDFLTKDFPVLDLSFFRLEREARYFQEQKKTLTKERKEFDQEASAILHKEVVLTKAKSAGIEALESEIGTLSKMYGMLASSRITIKQAHGTLDQDLRRTSRLIEDLLAPNAKENDLTTHYLPLYGRYLSSLAFEDELFEQSLENAKAAIDVVQTRVGLLRSGESLLLQRQTKGLLDQNILLQEEGVSLQAAASLIEFVIVFFYTLESWKALAEERIATVPVSWQFGLVFAFALSIVLCTHFAAKALRQKKKFSLKLLLAALFAFILIGLMAVVTILP